MQEKYKAFLTSISFGALISVITSYIIFFQLKASQILPSSFPGFSKYTTAISLTGPIIVLILSFIMQRRFASAWNDIRSRLLILASMLFTYMTVVILVGFLYSPAMFSFPEFFFIIFIMLIWYPVIIVTLLHSSIVTIFAAVFVTRGMSNLYKRVATILLLMWLIAAASASHLTLAVGAA